MRQVLPTRLRSVGELDVEATISTSAVARDGNILVPTGCDLANYRRNPIVLFQHQADCPVARASSITVQADRITARISFPPAGASPKADEVRGLVKAGIVSSVSVGFDIDRDSARPIDPKRPFGGLRISRWELLEVSFVSVPADTGAVVTARSSRRPYAAVDLDHDARAAAARSRLRINHAADLDYASRQREKRELAQTVYRPWPVNDAGAGYVVRVRAREEERHREAYARLDVRGDFEKRQAEKARLLVRARRH